MKMLRCEMRPGEVLQVVDCYGTVKASCVGIFDENDDVDKLPPISPWIRTSSTQFVQPHVGDKLWVLIFGDNPQELMYAFRGDVRTVDGGVLTNEYKDIEIQMKRETDNGEIQVSYNDEEGYMIDNAGTCMNIDNDAGIHMESKEGPAVSVTKDGISLGKDGGSQYKAVLGEKLIEVLNDIKMALDAINTSAAASPYTTHISSVLTTPLAKLNGFEKILSDMVTLQKD